MPTFRASYKNALSENDCDTQTGLPLFAKDEMLNELNDFLSKNQIEIILKIHHLQLEKTIFKKLFSNIIFLTDMEIQSRGLQLYEIVGKSDALITDYSSVSFDYYLVNKPICYILDDIESYQSNRGFVWDDILQVMPGHHINDLNQFYEFLLEVKDGKDIYAEKRNEVMHYVYDYSDDKSCERFDKFFFK